MVKTVKKKKKKLKLEAIVITGTITCHALELEKVTDLHTA